MSTQEAAVQQPPSNISISNNDGDVTPQQTPKTEKEKKRRSFFGLGKRKEGEKSPQSTPTQQEQVTHSATAPYSPVPALSTASPLDIPRAPRSPPQPFSLSAAASPARSARLRSSSPRLNSPDSSSIFERNVQDNTLPEDVAKDLPIPSHIQTEDHIPPALEASTIAITDDHLGPDEVKIVTHSAHLPAAEKVTGGTQTPGASEAGLSPVGGLSPIEDTGINIHQSLESSQVLGSAFSPTISAPGGSGGEDAASSYAGGADTADPRRLSFISFADVVQSEHVESSKDNMSLSLGSPVNRSPSPVRSPVSSQGISTSPPTSGAPSMKGLDIGGASKQQPLPPASPVRGAAAPRDGGEIVVETMRQALRRTGSGDLRNAASSPVDGKAPEEMVMR